MDFLIPAPGGVGAGAAAALAARGADPAINIPAGNHFFRRITSLVLSPVSNRALARPAGNQLELATQGLLAHTGERLQL